MNPDPDADTDYDGPDNIVLDPHGGLILAEGGRPLLASIQEDGYTAVTGPWRRPSNRA